MFDQADMLTIPVVADVRYHPVVIVGLDLQFAITMSGSELA